MKKILYRIFLITGILFCIRFSIGTASEIYMDSIGEYAYGSAPLYAYIGAQALLFLLPGVVCLAVSGLINRKPKKK